MVLGRAELKLNHPSISRQHAKIEFSADRPSIICQHENGISCIRNDKRILLKKGQKLPLVANTELSFGNSDKKFVVIYEKMARPENSKKRKHSATRTSGEPEKKKLKTGQSNASSSSDDDDGKVNAKRTIGSKPNQKQRTFESSDSSSKDDDDGKVNAKTKKNKRPSCSIGLRCIDWREQHREVKAKRSDVCVYGKKCIRTNPEHLFEFQH